MKKKHVPAPAVAKAQLEALRRLARSGKVHDALDRLDLLKARHPGFKPLYGLAWELARMADDPHWAAARALDWTHESPNNQAAWQALRAAASDCGMLALVIHAGLRLALFEGRAVPPPGDSTTPFGAMRYQELLANDTARTFMAVGRFDSALAALTGFEHPSLRNNVALIRFHQGDVAGALAVFEENWRREPRNLFALENIIRLRLWTRGRDAAAESAAVLKATPPMRSEDALAKVNALLILGDWEGADAAWRDSADAAFLQDQWQIGQSAAFDFGGGVAALRLGDFESMAQRFDAAGEAQPRLLEQIGRIESAVVMAELGAAPDIELADATHWFPRVWFDRLRATAARSGKEADDRYFALIDGCDAHPDYLGCVAQFGGGAGRMLAISVLKRRASNGDQVALQTLIGLLARPCGADSVRSDLLADLTEQQLLPEGGTISLLTKGKVHEVRSMTMHIHAEPTPPSLPPESYARLCKTFELMAQGKLQDAMVVLHDLIAQHPDDPALYNNLAGIKEGLRHPDSEVEALLDKARSLNPDYLFAIAGLARIAARRGEVNRAQALLAPLLQHTSYHFTAWRTILMTQLTIAQQSGEIGVVIGLQQQLAELQQQFE